MKRAEDQELSRVPASGEGQTSVRNDSRTVHPTLGQGNGSPALLKSLSNVIPLIVQGKAFLFDISKQDEALNNEQVWKQKEDMSIQKVSSNQHRM